MIYTRYDTLEEIGLGGSQNFYSECSRLTRMLRLSKNQLSIFLLLDHSLYRNGRTGIFNSGTDLRHRKTRNTGDNITYIKQRNRKKWESLQSLERTQDRQCNGETKLKKKKKKKKGKGGEIEKEESTTISPIESK